ncbi:NAD(P)-dependent oxidoreductase [Marinitenerispora sediminis]|uniref:6-phosphogluconate dehydrogenase n=1 Tax=Marinitenerispora sediminis TaxID=1931232 RepID=A0A368SZQ0_9ACTN|nr:NAD(P)-binding domain-containing protein [Marinitenerispora sediminis]RCV48117.1 6-phosphogluconate dehydrogenase [Marinitenerispora sediminis]RCV51072.1 6-phosphogluconate dehydrogenase [Marinitenerispora sediminis]RCV60740.1 6-phosphogluconate dehydrogenase [Marinitenerispora sediminis]
MRSRPEAVTVIGLGAMGSALAAALLDAGHPTTVWNRTPGRADALVARGAVRAATAAEAVAASRLVVVCVLDHAAVRGVLDPVAGTLAGRTLVNLTSGSPEQAGAAARWARSHGADYLDGAVMTTPPGVGDPRMMFLYSGSPAAVERHRAALSALGDPLDLGPEPGTASLYDAALLGLMWAALAGWAHGTALVTAERAEATAFTGIAVRWLTAVAGFMTTYAPQVDAGRYPGDDATVDVQIAAVEHLVHAGDARGIDGSLPRLLKATMERARDAGHGADSFGSVVEVLRAAAGAK